MSSDATKSLDSQRTAPSAVLERGKPVPDGAYLVKVVQRQAPFAAALFVAFIPLAFAIAWLQGMHYTSSVAALYDDRDSVEALPRYPYFPSFSQVLEAFKAKLNDTEFLWQVAQEGGLSARYAAYRPWSQRLRAYLPDGPMIDQWFPTAASREEGDFKEAVTRNLRSAIAPFFDDKKNTLGLSVTSDDPVLARQLAEAAMELFIQSELRFEAESYRRQHELFANYLHDVGRREDAERRSLGSQKLDEKAAARSEEDKLKDQEAELIDKIQAVKAEIDQEKARAVGARATLEADLARLTTKLQPSHPDVIAKQEELRGLNCPDDRALKGQLSKLRQDLVDVRAAERKLGMRVASGEVRDEPAQRGTFLPNLSDRVHELALLETGMSRQAESPALRTRLRVFSPANFDLVHRSRHLRMLTLGLLAFGGCVAICAGLLRELRTPLARDAWRVVALTQLPVLTELGRSGLRAYKSISPQLAKIMNSSALSKDHGGKAGAVLRSYRNLGLELQRRCQGRVVLLLNAGSADRSAAFFENFLNVVAGETAGSVLLIDCDQLDPVPAGQAFITVPFADFLAGKVAWKDVRLPRSPERAFDQVAASGREEAAPVYKVDVLLKLVATLEKSYSQIFIRGHDASQVLANAALLAAATDCVLCLDARVTTFSEVEQSLKLATAAKLRGLIMIGT